MEHQSRGNKLTVPLGSRLGVPVFDSTTIGIMQALELASCGGFCPHRR